MDFSKFRKKPIKQKSDNCKIIVKKKGNTTQLEISGNCSKEKLEVLKERMPRIQETSD